MLISPLMLGKMYKDIVKAYRGGNVEVYNLYLDQEVHSYVFTSMYPFIMVTEDMPVGDITELKVNPLKFGHSFKSLCNQLAFVKCSVFVDKSLDRPLYLTTVKLNGEYRNLCATGTFLNQWVYLPELCYYYQITNGKIRIIADSISKSYLFESKNIFKDYIIDLFKIKQSVNKSNPMYLISKLLMNSLYGRFGLKQELNEYKFINNQELEQFTMVVKEPISITDILNIGNDEQTLVV